MKKLLCLIFSAMLLLSLGLPALAEESETFTWWISRGEDTSYYDNYAQNPVVRYLLDTKTYQGKKLDLQFWQGISGAERDNFNNMLSTGDLADIIDLTYSDYTPATLFEDGYILDLTPYVEQYMPNYWNLVNNDPLFSEFGWSMVDGEKKILFLTNNIYPVEAFEGYCYRRDWIAKYGTNPETGASFTWSLDENGKWTDDVIFPCGKTDPWYISDWEWMFEIFTRAMADLGITDGYCISLYYQGANRVGDLYSGFGGGAPWWYRDEEGNAAFGGTSDNLRTYLTAMNSWYQKGWLDQHFAERSGDLFYIIDSKAVHQGKVGMWQGRQSEIGGGMDIGTPWTESIMIYGAAQPINDVYGGDAQKNHNPDTYYTQPEVDLGSALSKTAKGKDVGVFLSFMDTLYDPQISTVACNGFSKEMLDAMPEDAPWKQMYLKFNLPEGTWIENSGDPYFVAGVDVLLANAMKGNRLTKLTSLPIRHTDETRAPLLQQAIELWDYYPNTGYIRKNVEGLISARDMSRKAKIENNVLTYMSQSLPKFIMGQKGNDIGNDKDWENYCKVINKYGVDKVTSIYQEALDLLKQ